MSSSVSTEPIAARQDYALEATFAERSADSTPVELQVVELTDTLRLLATAVAIAHLAKATWADDQDLLSRIEKRVAMTSIIRLRYESPLEVALTVSTALFASTGALSALIFCLKRIYTVDLELRTDREEHRAAFLQAKAKAERAERDWLDQGVEPDFLPPRTLSVISHAEPGQPAHPSLDEMQQLALVLPTEDTS